MNKTYIIKHPLGDVTIFDEDGSKHCRSSWYNYDFNKDNGFFVRWGKTLEDDPEFAPSPEILDIEASTICSGIPNEKGVVVPCRFCYKSNTSVGTYMNLETFKRVIDKFPKSLTQIAIGIGDIDSNPDLWNIMDYSREIGIIPNITVNGHHINDENATKLVSRVGALAVSSYNPKDVCYNAVKLLTDKAKELGKTDFRANIHKMLSSETYDECFEIMKDAKEDPRLENLNAIVFLLLKPKGRGVSFHKLESIEKYKKLVDYAFENKIPIGFDSCSANSFLRSIKDHKNYKMLEMMVEPCESFGMFSSYINVDGVYYPCSFCEGEGDWKEGFNVLECEDFVKDIWNSEKLNKWKDIMTEKAKQHCCRVCPIFDLELPSELGGE